jgi:hypothetical protein
LEVALSAASEQRVIADSLLEVRGVSVRFGDLVSAESS